MKVFAALVFAYAVPFVGECSTTHTGSDFEANHAVANGAPVRPPAFQQFGSNAGQFRTDPRAMATGPAPSGSSGQSPAGGVPAAPMGEAGARDLGAPALPEHPSAPSAPPAHAAAPPVL